MGQFTNIENILEERGNRYGSLMDNARLAQLLKSDMRAARLAYVGLASDQKEALDMIASKISRILTGDTNYADSWVDIAGYATLVADRLIEEEKDNADRTREDDNEEYSPATAGL